MKPIDFLDIPSGLVNSMPADLPFILASALSLFTRKELLDTLPTPTTYDLLGVVSEILVFTTGMPHSVASVLDVPLVKLLQESNLVSIEACDGKPCNGKHNVSVTKKGIDFVASVFPKNSLNDKIDKIGGDFLSNWDDTISN